MLTYDYITETWTGVEIDISDDGWMYGNEADAIFNLEITYY